VGQAVIRLPHRLAGPRSALARNRDYAAQPFPYRRL